jgi:hypothetical protein
MGRSARRNITLAAAPTTDAGPQIARWIFTTCWGLSVMVSQSILAQAAPAIRCGSCLPSCIRQSYTVRITISKNF